MIGLDGDFSSLFLRHGLLSFPQVDLVLDGSDHMIELFVTEEIPVIFLHLEDRFEFFGEFLEMAAALAWCSGLKKQRNILEYFLGFPLLLGSENILIEVDIDDKLHIFLFQPLPLGQTLIY